jgi:hypothetical protein
LFSSTIDEAHVWFRFGKSEFSLENLLFVFEVDALHAMQGDDPNQPQEVSVEAARARAVEIYRYVFRVLSLLSNTS